MLSRRNMLMALPAAWGFLGRGTSVIAAAASSKLVAVAYPAALEPCAEAVEGLRLKLAGSELSVDLLDVEKATFSADAAQEILRKPAVVVAVGSDALRIILERELSAKTISTMTLEADRGGNPAGRGRVSAGIYLDIPIHRVVAELRKVFPEKTRVGVIRNPGRGGESVSQIRSQLQTGAVEIAACSSADELLPVFLAFRKKVDFVICLPDGSLYNSATARPLILASLENRLPIVGFSPAFLRAGAAVAVYPDYRGVGQQTGELVRRCTEPGDCASWETPRNLDVAVNAKVLRMLGMEYKTSANPDLVVLR